MKCHARTTGGDCDPCSARELHRNTPCRPACAERLRPRRLSTSGWPSWPRYPPACELGLTLAAGRFQPRAEALRASTCLAAPTPATKAPRALCTSVGRSDLCPRRPESWAYARAPAKLGRVQRALFHGPDRREYRPACRVRGLEHQLMLDSAHMCLAANIATPSLISHCRDRLEHERGASVPWSASRLPYQPREMGWAATGVKHLACRADTTG